MNNKAVVTLADSTYFEMLIELVDSITRFKESLNVDICVLDAGLSDNQLSTLSGRVKSIQKAEWDIKVPDYKVRGKEWLKSQVSRAFLPKYFPDYKKIFMD